MNARKFFKMFTVAASLLMASFAVYADDDGNDGSSGGTYALCNRSLESYHIDIRQLRGYEEYRQLMQIVRSKLPKLVQNLNEIENYNWFYFSSQNGCQIVPKEQKGNKSAPLELPFEPNEPVRLVPATRHVYVLGDQFDQLLDPETSILHEAIRGICSQFYTPHFTSDGRMVFDKDARKLLQIKQDGCVIDTNLVLMTEGRTQPAEKLLKSLKSIPNPPCGTPNHGGQNNVYSCNDVRVNPFALTQTEYQTALTTAHELRVPVLLMLSDADQLVQDWKQHYSDSKIKKSVRQDCLYLVDDHFYDVEVTAAGPGQIAMSGTYDQNFCSLTIPSRLAESLEALKRYNEGVRILYLLFLWNTEDLITNQEIESNRLKDVVAVAKTRNRDQYSKTLEYLTRLTFDNLLGIGWDSKIP